VSITRVIFVHGDNFLSKIIQKATGSEWAHVGIELFDGIVEALFEGVKLSERNKYDLYHTDYVSVDIPEIDAAEEKARQLLNTSYGFLTDNFTGAVHALTGIVLVGNEEKTVNCSETVTRILRAGGLDILCGIEADAITPGDLYGILKYPVS
jgi:hypothetical protein